MISRDSAFKIAAGAGMLNKEIEMMFQNSELLVEKALQAR
jgi:hypothetical protein